MKLNLGCGRRYLPDFVNIDAYEEPGVRVDVVWDIEKTPWRLGRPQAVERSDDMPIIPPIIPTGEVTEVVAAHVLEHIHDLCGVMTELYRVMAPGAALTITVPHHLSESYWGDPSHVRPITLAQMELFSRTKCDEFEAKGWSNTLLARRLGVDFAVKGVAIDLMPHWKSKGLDRASIDWAILSYANVVNEVTFHMRRV